MRMTQFLRISDKNPQSWTIRFIEIILPDFFWMFGQFNEKLNCSKILMKLLTFPRAPSKFNENIFLVDFGFDPLNFLRLQFMKICAIFPKSSK